MPVVFVLPIPSWNGDVICSYSSGGLRGSVDNGGLSKSSIYWNMWDGLRRSRSQSWLARICNMASNSSSTWWARSSTSRTWSLLWWPVWWAGLHPPKLLLIKQGLWRWSRFRTWSTSWRMQSMLWTGTTSDACSSKFTPGRGGVTWRTWTPSSLTSSRPAQVLLALWKGGAASTKLQRVKNVRPSTCLSWPPSGESLQHHGVWTSSLRWKQLACL